MNRILCIAGVIGALATVIVAFDANAFSISPVPNRSSNVTLVAGGCGLGFHRGPYGGCRPNIAGYPAVGYAGVAYTVAAACIIVAERYPFMPLDEPMRTAV